MGASVSSAHPTVCLRAAWTRDPLVEKPMMRLKPLVDSVLSAIEYTLVKPYALYGHSLGAFLAFELAHGLRERGVSQPMHLVVSSARPPHLDRSRHIHELPEPAFIEELRRLRGTPDEILNHTELLKLMVPSIRSDFELLETYRYRAAQSLTCPITAIGGLADAEVKRGVPTFSRIMVRVTGRLTLRSRYSSSRDSLGRRSIAFPDCTTAMEPGLARSCR